MNEGKNNPTVTKERKSWSRFLAKERVGKKQIYQAAVIVRGPPLDDKCRVTLGKGHMASSHLDVRFTTSSNVW